MIAWTKVLHGMNDFLKRFKLELFSTLFETQETPAEEEVAAAESCAIGSSQNSLNKPKQTLHVVELVSRQSFPQNIYNLNICNLIHNVDVSDQKLSGRLCFSNFMVLDVNMLHASMELKISYQLYCRLVVNVKQCGASLCISQVMQQATHPNDLL